MGSVAIYGREAQLRGQPHRNFATPGEEANAASCSFREAGPEMEMYPVVEKVHMLLGYLRREQSSKANLELFPVEHEG